MNRPPTPRALALALTLAVLAATAGAPALHAQETDRRGVVRVATLVYGGGKTGICFGPGFLEAVAFETGIHVQRTFDSVDLAGDDLFNYPFVVMTGEGAFTLTDAEKVRLKQYVERGGFLLASAGCSNAAWTRSFTAAIGEVFGKHALQPLDPDHPIFHTLYDIDRIQLKTATPDPAIYGLTHQGRIHLLFSPMGLNDTAGAATGCCCCGGNEVRNAKLINANILTYALTH